QRLYVVTPDHTSPAGHQVHVAALDNAFYLGSTLSDVVIDGFEMRYYGQTAPYGGIGAQMRGARCWVRNCNIHHMNRGIWILRSTGIENVIEGNTIRDT